MVTVRVVGPAPEKGPVWRPPAGRFDLVRLEADIEAAVCRAWREEMMAMTLVLMRLCEPSSELRIAEHLYERSTLADLLGIPPDKVNDDRLYRALDRLLPRKVEMEKHLKERLGELFNLEYDLLLYDVTSTYFEEEAAHNRQAMRGYPRDHRPDCKQVCIALVVSKEGLPLGYEVFAGNRADVTTVEDTPRQPLR